MSILQWKKRRKIEETSIAKHLTRESVCGNYRVIEWQGLLPSTKDEKRFYAMTSRVSGEKVFWDILSEHKKQGPATEACNKHARERAKATTSKRRKS